MKSPTRIIIDTDPGVDDAIAILMALAVPDLEVLGLTTVGGNVPLARAARNALALLEYAQRPEVPVARGASRPLRGRFPYAHYFHGQSGLTRRLPQPKAKSIQPGAVDFLAQQLQQWPGTWNPNSLPALGGYRRSGHRTKKHANENFWARK